MPRDAMEVEDDGIIPLAAPAPAKSKGSVKAAPAGKAKGAGAGEDSGEEGLSVKDRKGVIYIGQ